MSAMRLAEPRHPAASIPRSARVAVAAMFLGLSLGCTGARANNHYRYPREVSYGRTSTCPDVRLPPLRDGNVSPDAARCSFADANGARVTHLAGKVLAEGGPGDPGLGVSGVKVTAHALTGPVFDPAAPGKLIAHGSTDAQGNYSLRGVFVPADYALVVHEPTGETIAVRIVRVDEEALGEVKGVHVVIPLDPRLKAEAAPPPPARLDQRLHPGDATGTAAGTTTGTPTPPVTSTTPVAPTSPASPAAPGTSLKPPPAGIRMRPPGSGATVSD